MGRSLNSVHATVARRREAHVSCTCSCSTSAKERCDTCIGSCPALDFRGFCSGSVRWERGDTVCWSKRESMSHLPAGNTQLTGSPQRQNFSSSSSFSPRRPAFLALGTGKICVGDGDGMRRHRCVRGVNVRGRGTACGWLVEGRRGFVDDCR